jgi:hypothetical protein
MRQQHLLGACSWVRLPDPSYWGECQAVPLLMCCWSLHPAPQPASLCAMCCKFLQQQVLFHQAAPLGMQVGSQQPHRFMPQVSRLCPAPVTPTCVVAALPSLAMATTAGGSREMDGWVRGA